MEEGKKAPAFSLTGMDGTKVSLKDFKGSTVVLYFYPRDNTPGCTTEANDFNGALEEFGAAGAVVIGISKDSVESHCKFRDKHGLAFQLLSDPEGKVINAYGAWGEKNLYGRKSMGIIRSTVVIDGKGKVARIFPKVRVKGHIVKVLEAVHDLD